MLAVRPPAVLPRVSALYDSVPYVAFQLNAANFRFNGMRSSRLSLLGEASRDARRARRLGPRETVRLDAHNLWSSASVAIARLMEIRDHAWAVEEPVTPRDWRAMEEVKEATGLAIIAGASIETLADLEAMPSGREFIPSLRVSKQGGLPAVSALIARAREQGRAIIISAEPGESSILARAGLVLASAANGALITTEIAYATHDLQADAATPPLRFRRDGVLDVFAFDDRPGWGSAPHRHWPPALPERHPQRDRAIVRDRRVSDLCVIAELNVEELAVDVEAEARHDCILRLDAWIEREARVRRISGKAHRSRRALPVEDVAIAHR